MNEFTSVLVSYVLKHTSVPLNTHLADIFINPVLLHWNTACVLCLPGHIWQPHVICHPQHKNHLLLSHWCCSGCTPAHCSNILRCIHTYMRAFRELKINSCWWAAGGCPPRGAEVLWPAPAGKCKAQTEIEAMQGLKQKCKASYKG